MAHRAAVSAGVQPTTPTMEDDDDDGGGAESDDGEGAGAPLISPAEIQRVPAYLSTYLPTYLPTYPEALVAIQDSSSFSTCTTAVLPVATSLA